MKYSKLGNSGAIVSKLALGTMYFGSETPESEAFEIMDEYVEAGGNFIDTANVYVGGLSEEIVGRWFARRPHDVTDRVVLTTKGRFSVDPGVNGAGLSRRNLHRSLDRSLRSLGREAIDLYQLHAWDPLTPVEETLSFLDSAVQVGKINYIGLSNFTGWQLQLFVSTAKQMGLQLPVTLQLQYSLLSRESEWEIAPAALHNGIGLLPWSPLAGGFLAGKYERYGEPSPITRAGSEKPLYQWTMAEYAELDRNWATIDTVIRIAREIGATPAQVALSWIASRSAVVAPIFGARTVKQLRENLIAADLHLDDEMAATLEGVSRPKSGGYPYGLFGSWQRARAVDGSNQAQKIIDEGSDAPLGRK